MSNFFAYRRQGRRPAVWLAAGCLGFVAAAGLMDGTPFPMWILWVLAGAPVVWVIVTNPSDGMLIDGDRLILSPWRSPRIVARADIDRIEVRGRAAQTEVTLVLRSGARLDVNPRDLPDGPKLQQAFEKFDLPVTYA